MKRRYFFASLLMAACFCTVSALSAQEAAPAMPERGICAHRGDNFNFPENTVPAFEEAVRLHAGMIEFDARFTKDHQLVLMHDWTVDRTSNGKGDIYTWTFEDVRKLDFGAWKNEKFAGTQIPTLDEALAVFPKDVWLNIHCDVPPEHADIEEELGLAVAEHVIAAGREHQAFLACSHKMADAVKAKYPQFLICNMERQGGEEVYVKDTISRGTDFIQTAYKHPTADQVDRLKKAGIKINYFGSNDPQEIRDLFESGVDFPLVDNVPLGMKVFEEMENK